MIGRRILDTEAPRHRMAETLMRFREGHDTSVIDPAKRV
jgi:hypothetical protein